MPCGKLVRGLSVVDSVKILQGCALGEDEYFKAALLGWCIRARESPFSRLVSPFSSPLPNSVPALTLAPPPRKIFHPFCVSFPFLSPASFPALALASPPRAQDYDGLTTARTAASVFPGVGRHNGPVGDAPPAELVPHGGREPHRNQRLVMLEGAIYFPSRSTSAPSRTTCTSSSYLTV